MFLLPEESSDHDSKSAIVYGLAVNDPRPRKKNTAC